MKRGTSRRSTRIGDQIMRALAELLVEKTRDPRLEMVTISGVTMNADLTLAKVMYTLHGGEEDYAEAAKAFEQAKGWFRTALGKQLRLKYLPELRFVRDDYLEEIIYDRPQG